MKTLYEPYPESVEVCGTEYPIETDFREWIKFGDMLRDPEITREQVAYGMATYFDDEIPDDGDEASYALIAFYLRKTADETREILQPKPLKKNEPPPKRKPQLFDYAYDADCIFAGFYQAYRIDLDTVRYLHWHKFHALLDHLPEETEFRQRIYYRGKDTSKIKNNDERKRVLEIQRKIALPDAAPTIDEIGDLFW